MDLRMRLPIMAVAFILSVISPLAIDLYIGNVSLISTEFEKSGSLSLSAFLLSLGLGQLVFGKLIDKHGPKLISLILLIGFSFSSYLIYLSTSFEGLIALRFIQGFMVSGISLSSMAIIDANFKGDEKATKFGHLNSVMNVVPATAPMIGVYLAETLGDWRFNFLILSLIGLIIFIVIGLFSVNEKSKENKVNEKKEFDFIDSKFKKNAFMAISSLALLFSYLSIFPSTVDKMEYGPYLFSIFFAVNALTIGAGGIVLGKLFNKMSSQEILNLMKRVILVAAVISIGSIFLSELILLSFLLFCFIFPWFISIYMERVMTAVTHSNAFVLSVITFLQMVLGSGIGVVLMVMPNPSVSFFSLLTIIIILGIKNDNISRRRVKGDINT